MSTPTTTLALLITLVASPFLPAQRSGEPRKIRVVVVETAKTEADSLARRLPELGPFETRGATKLAVDDETREWMEVVVLAAAPKDEAGSIEKLEALRAANVGLVVTAAAASAWPESKQYAKLLGRSESSTPSPPTAAGDLIVEVLDQSHDITQSVTHFRHAGALHPRKLERRCRLLAQAFRTTKTADEETTTPVIWSVGSGSRFARFGRGPLVTVVALDPSRGPSRDLVASLIGRAAEHSLRRRVSTKLGGKYVLAVKGLAPDQIGVRRGKPARRGFFRGRQIAGVMSYLGADWLTRPDRATHEHPDKVIESLGVGPGQTIADIGCGNGYFTLRMAKKAAPGGRVLGVDIQKEMLTLLRERAAKQKVTNVEAILATETDPKLPENAIDLALMVDVYHELAKPTPVMRAIHKALKKDGRVVLVEYRGEDPTVMIKPLHRTTVQQMREELEDFGFRLIENKSFLPQQHILIFGKKD